MLKDKGFFFLSLNGTSRYIKGGNYQFNKYNYRAD